MAGSWKWQLRDSGGQWIDMNLSVQFTDRGRVTSGKVVGSPRSGVALVERNDNGRRIELPSSSLTALSGKKPGEGVNLGDKRGTRIKVGDTVTSHGETYEVVGGDWREQRITVVAPDGYKTTIRADSAVVSDKSEKASLPEGAGESTGLKDATGREIKVGDYYEGGGGRKWPISGARMGKLVVSHEGQEYLITPNSVTVKNDADGPGMPSAPKVDDRSILDLSASDAVHTWKVDLADTRSPIERLAGRPAVIADDLEKHWESWTPQQRKEALDRADEAIDLIRASIAMKQEGLGLSLDLGPVDDAVEYEKDLYRDDVVKALSKAVPRIEALKKKNTPKIAFSPEKKSLNLGDSRGRRLSAGDRVTWDSFLAGSDSYTVTGGNWRDRTLTIMDSSGETRTVGATSVSIIASGDFLYDWSYRIGYRESGSMAPEDPVIASMNTDKHDFKNRLKMAKHGTAMKDGSYPISDAEDLHNAIQSFGRAKDPEATKRHIIKRARALKMISALPEKWGVKK